MIISLPIPLADRSFKQRDEAVLPLQRPTAWFLLIRVVNKHLAPSNNEQAANLDHFPGLDSVSVRCNVVVPLFASASIHRKAVVATETRHE